MEVIYSFSEKYQKHSYIFLVILVSYYVFTCLHEDIEYGSFPLDKAMEHN